MRKTLSSLLARLHRDERGAGVVELAILLPVLALMTTGIVDLSNGLSERLRLHRAVHQTLEIAAAHRIRVDPNASQPNYDFLAAEAATAADVPEDQVTLTKWLECDGVEQPDFYDDCDAGQAIARYVQIRIDNDFKPMFDYGPLGRASGYAAADGTVPLFAEAAVRVQ